MDMVTYNILIKGFCAEKNMNAVKEVMEEIESSGRKLNEVTYNLLTDAFGVAGNVQAAKHYIDRMHESGSVVDHYNRHSHRNNAHFIRSNDGYQEGKYVPYVRNTHVQGKMNHHCALPWVI